MPKVNSEVLCLYLPVFSGDGFVLGRAVTLSVSFADSSPTGGAKDMEEATMTWLSLDVWETLCFRSQIKQW